MNIIVLAGTIDEVDYTQDAQGIDHALIVLKVPPHNMTVLLDAAGTELVCAIKARYTGSQDRVMVEGKLEVSTHTIRSTEAPETTSLVFNHQVAVDTIRFLS